jgi:hypothetical protein
MSTDTITTQPNVRTYDVADKKVLRAALLVTCAIPYCRAEVGASCTGSKGQKVEPHTIRVRKAESQRRRALAAAEKAGKATKAAAEKPAAKEETTSALAAVCKPCLTSHHKQCKGSTDAPCGCGSKTHAAKAA